MKGFGAYVVCAALLMGAVSAPLEAATKKKKKSAPKHGSGNYVIEKRKDGTTVKYKKKETYDFEGLGVEGVYDKPTGSYISNIKDVKAKSLIQIRKNFDAEVQDSSRQMP